MMRMTGGTKSVAMMTPNTIFFPRNSILANGYAPIAAGATTSAALQAAGIMLFANHRSTGVPSALRIERYAAVVGFFGIHVGGTAVASLPVLNDVTNMKMSGLRKSSARTVSTT